MTDQNAASFVASAFPNAKALPLWIARDFGMFARRGLQVRLDFTESSAAQRKDLETGRIHLAQSAVDNALAMILRGLDVVIVMGGETGMNDFMARPHIDSFAAFAGHTLVVDSPDTAYALQAKKLLATLGGLKPGRDYAVEAIGNSASRFRALVESDRYGGGVLNPPFSTQARLRGLRSLGRLVDLLGPYQAGGAYLLRDWARANSRRVESYLGAYVEALRWLRAPANKAAAVAVLERELALARPEAAATFEDLTDPSFGFSPDAKLDRAGLANVLATRAEIEGSSERLARVEDYVDEAYYRRALEKDAEKD